MASAIPVVRYDNTGGGSAPITQSIGWQTGTVINGNALQVSQNFQETPADGDIVEWATNVEPGNYNLTITCVYAGLSGIQDIYVDGVLAGTVDRYNAAFITGQVDVIPITVINNPGVIRSVVNGKNVLSGDFYINMEDLQIA